MYNANSNPHVNCGLGVLKKSQCNKCTILVQTWMVGQAVLAYSRDGRNIGNLCTSHLILV